MKIEMAGYDKVSKSILFSLKPTGEPIFAARSATGSLNSEIQFDVQWKSSVSEYFVYWSEYMCNLHGLDATQPVAKGTFSYRSDFLWRWPDFPLLTSKYHDYARNGFRQ